MTAVARASRRLSAVSHPRGFATDVSKKIEPSASTDRFKWDYRGPRKIIPLGQWLPTLSWPARSPSLTDPPCGTAPSSVWNSAVLNKITLGFCSNVQERCVVHAAWTSPTWLPAETSIDGYVTVGAYCLLRSCTIEPECIIGQNYILMEGSLVESHSILEAGLVLPPGRRVPTDELWAGNPARFMRTLTHKETLGIPKLAVAINDLSRNYFSEFLPYSTLYLEVEKLKKSPGGSI